jgi:hypothetical protein
MGNCQHKRHHAQSKAHAFLSSLTPKEQLRSDSTLDAAPEGYTEMTLSSFASQSGFTTESPAVEAAPHRLYRLEGAFLSASPLDRKSGLTATTKHVSVRSSLDSVETDHTKSTVDSAGP